MTFEAVPFLGAAQPLSALLHLVGAGVYGLLTVRLLRRARGRLAPLLSLGVFAVSCVTVLAISGIYHFTPMADPWRSTLQRVDHAAIFLLIAGTLTPFHLFVFHGGWRYVAIGLVWALAISAIAMKIFYFHSLMGALGLSMYIGLGLVGLLSVFLLPRRIGAWALAPMALGGLAYGSGAVLEFNGLPVILDGIAGPHEFFHATVLVGSAFHWRFLGGIVDD